MKAGLLMEAAEAQLKLADGALKRLEALTRSLEPTVRQSVGDAASEAVSHAARMEFAQLRAETQRTAQALHGIRGGIGWNLGFWACLMALVTATVLVSGLYLVDAFAAPRPTAAAPAGLRGDPAVLAEFARRGLQLEVSLCGPARQPCVKVDPKAGAQTGLQGTRRDFMLVPTLNAPPAPTAP